MNLKITFINPNTKGEVDKYLPKILAEAVISKMNRDNNGNGVAAECKGKYSA